MASRQSQEPYDIPDDDIRSAAARIISAYESGHFQKYAQEQHFLMIGRSGTGKSSLAGVLINGESDEGSFGAHAGTTELVLTREVKKNNIKYFIHETRGLGDGSVNLDDMKVAVKRVYDNNDCLVFVCIRWDDRFTDWNSKLALEVCNSLGDDVWNKAIIAITHSDILPGRVKRDSRLKAQFIKDTKSEWISTIRDELRQHGVSENTTRAVQICFTSHTDEDCEAEPGWRQKLGEGLLTIAREYIRKMSGELMRSRNGAYGYVLNAFNNLCSIDKLVAALQDTVSLPAGAITNTRAHSNGRSGCSQSSTTARPNVPNALGSIGNGAYGYVLNNEVENTLSSCHSGIVTAKVMPIQRKFQDVSQQCPNVGLHYLVTSPHEASICYTNNRHLRPAPPTGEELVWLHDNTPASPTCSTSSQQMTSQNYYTETMSSAGYHSHDTLQAVPHQRLSIPPQDVLHKSPSRPDLLRQLAPISDVWDLIGYALDIDNHIINGLKRNECRDMARLAEILQAWIEKDKDVTWKTIIEAIEGPIVDKKFLANKIRQYLKT